MPSKGWEYKDLPNYKLTLVKQAAEVVEDIRSRRMDVLALLANLRSVHLRMFTGLTPANEPDYAGHFRGEPIPYLLDYAVGIPANPSVGAPPADVVALMSQFETNASQRIHDLDNYHNQNAPEEERLIETIKTACEIFAEFCRIHPFANGNGHVGRTILLSILARYQYWPDGFTLDPAPPDPPYSLCVKQHQDGDPIPLEKFVLKCIRGRVAPPPPPPRKKKRLRR